MEYNLSFNEVIGRYALMMTIVIIGGFTGHISVMLLGIPFFLTGLLGWCPIYTVLGINHAVKTDSDEG